MAEPIRVYLVRHGHAAQSWELGTDSGLSDVGHQQASNVAAEMEELGPLPIVTSPLRRARETASAFETRWQAPARIDHGVSEIPSPSIHDAERQRWLMQKMAGTWSAIHHEVIHEQTLGDWRDGVIQTLLDISRPTIVTTHYIAINVAVGAATGDDRIVSFRPDNASCTVLDIVDGTIKLVKLGAEAQTKIG